MLDTRSLTMDGDRAPAFRSADGGFGLYWRPWLAKKNFKLTLKWSGNLAAVLTRLQSLNR